MEGEHYETETVQRTFFFFFCFFHFSKPLKFVWVYQAGKFPLGKKKTYFTLGKIGKMSFPPLKNIPLMPLSEVAALYSKNKFQKHESVNMTLHTHCIVHAYSYEVNIIHIHFILHLSAVYEVT